MSYSDMVSYLTTLMAITLSPGPITMMLIVRSASKDLSGAFFFGLGFALGGVIIISLVCFGLSAWMTDILGFLKYSKYLMMAYILWLAYGVWKGGFDLAGECSSKNSPAFSSMGAGVLTCFISPYMIVLFPLVLPGLMDITTIQMPQFLILAVITFTAFLAGAILIIAFAAQISRLANSQHSMMILRRCLSSILVVAGGWMAFY